MFVIIYSWI